MLSIHIGALRRLIGVVADQTASPGACIDGNLPNLIWYPAAVGSGFPTPKESSELMHEPSAARTELDAFSMGPTTLKKLPSGSVSDE